MRVIPFPVGEQSMRFLHDNFDFDVEDGTWFYAFHTDTLPIEDVKDRGGGERCFGQDVRHNARYGFLVVDETGENPLAGLGAV